MGCGFFGTVRHWPHVGHWTETPAPASSTMMCCPHLEQSKVMSMLTPLVAVHPTAVPRALARLRKQSGGSLERTWKPIQLGASNSLSAATVLSNFRQAERKRL